MDNINIVFEDNDLMVIEKPAGVLVHPTFANEGGTVVSWLLEKYPSISKLNWIDNTRPGIVHRLDKDTSGLLIIAKTPEILLSLQQQFKNHEVKKEYTALVFGKVNPEKGSVIADIARHKSKDKQTIVSDYEDGGRASQTDYETLNNYQYKKQDLTLVLCKPQSGRMHQIRIHLKHIGYPIIGDQMYFFKPSRRLSKELDINRQFLHATKITFTYPKTKEIISFDSKLANDLNDVLQKVKS